MRAATSNTAWLIDPHGEMVGLSLGSDPCTEHESGTAGLKAALGVPSSFERGLADRVNTRVPPGLAYHEYTLKGQPAAWLVFGERSLGSSHEPLTKLPPHLESELRFPEFGAPSNLACAWDENGASVMVRTTQEVERLRAFHQSLLGHDIAFGGALVDRDAYPHAGGLVFVRASKLSPEIAAKALAGDQSAVRLRAAASELGIAEELRAAGRRWFALSPRWKDAQESEVVFWLNPMEQSDYAAGLFSVSQLRQWAAGEGPVMIDKPLVALQKKHTKELQRIASCIERSGKQSPYLHIEWADALKKAFHVQVGYYGEPGRKPRVVEGVMELADLSAQYPKPAPAPRLKRAMK